MVVGALVPRWSMRSTFLVDEALLRTRSFSLLSLLRTTSGNIVDEAENRPRDKLTNPVDWGTV